MLELEEDGRWYLDGAILLAGDKVQAYFPESKKWQCGQITFSDIVHCYLVSITDGGIFQMRSDSVFSDLRRQTEGLTE